MRIQNYYSMDSKIKPHAICLPFPAQGHINPMFKLAKLLHHKGFHITFVNTEYNHRRLSKSRGPNSLDGLPDFQFRTIPDGLPPQAKEDSTQDILALSLSTSKNCLVPFCELIRELNDTSSLSSCSNLVPPVTCIVFDIAMIFGVEAAELVGVPCISLYTASACAFLAYTQFPFLVENGIMPPKDESWLTNGYSEKTVDWIPALRNVRLKDLPSEITAVNGDHSFVDYVIGGLRTLIRCSAIILNTFDAFERNALDGLANILPPIYAVGPLQLIESDQLSDTESYKQLGVSLWKEESECLDWLSTKEPNSVVYVNFGSITVLTADQLMEFAWGLANSGYSFLWIIRPDLVAGESAILPQEFLVETQGKCMLTSWCPQERVLMHPSIGCFLTHCGWNSTIECVCGGVPMICWPFFADQAINCRFCCIEWGIGREMDKEVRREDVEKLLKGVMDGNVGKEMKNKVTHFQNLAREAARPGGSSYQNLDMLISTLLQSKLA